MIAGGAGAPGIALYSASARKRRGGAGDQASIGRGIDRLLGTRSSRVRSSRLVFLPCSQLWCRRASDFRIGSAHAIALSWQSPTPQIGRELPLQLRDECRRVATLNLPTTATARRPATMQASSAGRLHQGLPQPAVRGQPDTGAPACTAVLLHRHVSDLPAAWRRNSTARAAESCQIKQVLATDPPAPRRSETPSIAA